MQLPMLPPGHHIPPETVVNHEQFQQPNMYNYPMRAPIPPQYGPPPNYINPSFNPHFIHPEYRIYELNKRLQQRTEDSDNLWWEAFVTEFFEDDAKLTMSFCLEDGPKRYCINRTLVPRFFRSIFEGGAVDLYFMLRYWKEIYHGPAPPLAPTTGTGPIEGNAIGPGGRAGMGKHPQTPLFLTMDCEHASMVTILDKPMFTKIVSEGRLLLDFIVFDDIIRIKRWHFIIRHHTELIPRNVLAMQDPSILEQLSKNVTRSGLTNTTLNYLRLCVILEPMAELMSRHKAYALTPRDCMKTTLFQKWQKIMGNNDHHPPPPHHPHHHPHPHGNGPASFGMMNPQGPVRYPQGPGPAPPLLNGRPGSNASQVGGGMPHPSGIPTPTSIPTPTTIAAPPKATKTRRKRKSDNNAGGPNSGAMQSSSPGKKRGSLAASASLSSSSLNSLGNMVLNNHQQHLQQQQVVHQGLGPPFNPAQHGGAPGGGPFNHPVPNNPPMFSLASQDVMIVGEPTLMGGEFGDEDERLIARLENIQYGDGVLSMMGNSNNPQQQHYNNSNPGGAGAGGNVFADTQQHLVHGNNNNGSGGCGIGNSMVDMRNQFHQARHPNPPNLLNHHNSFRNVNLPGPALGAEEDLLASWSAHPPPPQQRPDPPQDFGFGSALELPPHHYFPTLPGGGDCNANSAPPSMEGGGAGHPLRRPPSLPVVFTPREGASRGGGVLSPNPHVAGGGPGIGGKCRDNIGTPSLSHFGSAVSPQQPSPSMMNNKK